MEQSPQQSTTHVQLNAKSRKERYVMEKAHGVYVVLRAHEVEKLN